MKYFCQKALKVSLWVPTLKSKATDGAVWAVAD
jgi:hypothetical protein